MILERQSNTYTGYLRSEWPGVRAMMNDELFFSFYQTWTQTTRHSTETQETWFYKPWGDTILNIGSPLTSGSLMRLPWSHRNADITQPGNKFYTPEGYSYAPNGPHSVADNFPYSTWGDGGNTQNTGRFQAEGDTPAYLFAIDNGLRSYENPEWGGWAGRYGLSTNEAHPNEYRDNRSDVPPAGSTVTAKNWTFSRWILDIQGTYSVHAQWSVTPNYNDTNHYPKAAVMNGLDIDVTRGESITLKGVASDPDGDDLTYRWWRYADADTMDGTGTIEVSDTKDAVFTVPEDANIGDTIHLILKVSDAESNELYTTLRNYKRVVLTVGEPVENSVILNLDGDLAATEGEDVVYTVSAKNMNKLATATLWVEVDGEYLNSVNEEGMNVFNILNGTWTQGEGTKWIGQFTLTNMEGGVTSAGELDILKLSMKAKDKLGVSDISIKRFELSGYDENNIAVFMEGELENGTVTTEVLKSYSKYDVNRDGKVDQLDLTTAQLHYAAELGDSNWNRYADVNDDGRIDSEDFILILNNIIWS